VKPGIVRENFTGYREIFRKRKPVIAGQTKWRKPQPGLALLKLAQDQPLATTEAIRQAEQENRDPGADRISLSGSGRPRNRGTGIGCRQLDIPPAQLGNIKQPVSLIWGRHDRAIKLKVAEEASNRYGCPKNRTIRIDHRS
jgi:pimeloyl-ACP methyl ester carboxylesterase